jgi:hypothetical protein
MEHENAVAGAVCSALHFPMRHLLQEQLRRRLTDDIIYYNIKETRHETISTGRYRYVQYVNATHVCAIVITLDIYSAVKFSRGVTVG